MRVPFEFLLSWAKPGFTLILYGPDFHNWHGEIFQIKKVDEERGILIAVGPFSHGTHLSISGAQCVYLISPDIAEGYIPGVGVFRIYKKEEEEKEGGEK